MAKILLVDEPTKGLAPKIVAEVAETLADLTASTSAAPSQDRHSA